ncbi:hypothetical protein RK21_02766 [Pseudomonas plecoglossicida]|nr:hypothetical protein RK21_02766 [Pseudomonas plecoglossicida]
MALGLLVWCQLLRGFTREEANTDSAGLDICDLSARGYD